MSTNITTPRAIAPYLDEFGWMVEHGLGSVRVEVDPFAAMVSHPIVLHLEREDVGAHFKVQMSQGDAESLALALTNAARDVASVASADHLRSRWQQAREEVASHAANSG